MQPRSPGLHSKLHKDGRSCSILSLPRAAATALSPLAFLLSLFLFPKTEALNRSLMIQTGVQSVAARPLTHRSRLRFGSFAWLALCEPACQSAIQFCLLPFKLESSKARSSKTEQKLSLRRARNGVGWLVGCKDLRTRVDEFRRREIAQAATRPISKRPSRCALVLARVCGAVAISEGR